MDRLKFLYQAVIMDHSEQPKNKGELEEFTAEKTIYNPTCGDTIKVQIVHHLDCISDIAFDGQGCAISMASASIMTDLMKEKTIDEARALIHDFYLLVQGKELSDKKSLGEAAALEGVVQFPTRIRCAQLAWKALEDCMNQVEDDT